MESQFPSLHLLLWFQWYLSPLLRRPLPSIYIFGSGHSLCSHVLLQDESEVAACLQIFDIYSNSDVRVGEERKIEKCRPLTRKRVINNNTERQRENKGRHMSFYTTRSCLG